MTRAEIEQRLIDLERQIEQHRTGIWLAEFEREQLRTKLRRLMHAEGTKVAA
ncbi:MAG: hypothetical protein QOF32_344 [Gammaproteobacteria bacterium]|jgi:hypothetical protein|nr:hypothetical protein [Gammaproteobacteria bacterium]